ncbi:uncharacterized protein LOC131956680 [Physella acuta]|uniref:uncharacterized protein LOC131956680 n=1 Tax=Physella acuta TaxID=109671 RepID=UPI0027DB79AF|nr:uncharacterized protein LOC131956680 [Physella acuta]XP_059177208.1 uncharacterized protein LOC131956680 [Physella acuta]
MRCYLPIALALLPLYVSAELLKLTDDVKNAFVKAHNDARAKAGAKPLKWHKNAEDYAKNHIAKCLFEHSKTKYGENMYASSAKPGNLLSDAAAAVKGWVDEKKFADPPKWKCMRDKCGHYTQVIWKKTKYVGCAISSCKGKHRTMIACEYYPPGNVIGQEP